MTTNLLSFSLLKNQVITKSIEKVGNFRESHHLKFLFTIYKYLLHLRALKNQLLQEKLVNLKWPLVTLNFKLQAI